MNDEEINLISNIGKREKRSSKPALIVLDQISPDPNQPRKKENPGFSDESLLAFSETIKERGVKSPISVRPDPENPGKYIINHGERRYQASILAGKLTIPAFVDDDYSPVDQLLENLDREDLTRHEIAISLGKLKENGLKGKEIATQVGRSEAWVSLHLGLLDLPEFLDEAWDSGIVSDIVISRDLNKLYGVHGQEVENFVKNSSETITRKDVSFLKKELKAKENPIVQAAEAGELDSDKPQPTYAPLPEPEIGASKEEKPESKTANSSENADEFTLTEPPEVLETVPKETETKPKKLNLELLGEVKGNKNGDFIGIILREPAQEGRVWMKPLEKGNKQEVRAENITILGLKSV